MGNKNGGGDAYNSPERAGYNPSLFLFGRELKDLKEPLRLPPDRVTVVKSCEDECVDGS
jgi:hypothetical protein